MTSRPSTTCRQCGRVCRATSRLCQTCRHLDHYPVTTPTRANALTGGAWTYDPKRWVQVWVPDGTEVPELDDDTLPQDVACPTCMARLWEVCHTESGRLVEQHARRLGPRQCRCGAAVTPKRTYCDDCRRVARRTARLKWARASRAARLLDVEVAA